MGGGGGPPGGMSDIFDILSGGGRPRRGAPARAPRRERRPQTQSQPGRGLQRWHQVRLWHTGVSTTLIGSLNHMQGYQSHTLSSIYIFLEDIELHVNVALMTAASQWLTTGGLWSLVPYWNLV